MKKKFLLALLLVAVFTLVLAFTVSAETPKLYIEFQVKLAGNSEYTTAYVENTEEGNPRVNLTFDFYSDVGFTQKIDKSQITVLDFSSAVHSNPKKDYVDRFTTAEPNVFPNCEEVKWFSRAFTSTPSNTFNGWTQLKRFDFGCITAIDYNFLSGTGLEEVVLPTSIKTLNNSVFAGCKSLKTVTVEGSISSVGLSTFADCTALETANLGSITVISDNMFSNCSSLNTITIPSTVTSIRNNAFLNCTSLTSAVIEEGVTSTGNSMFNGCTSLASVSLPSTLLTIGNSTFQNCKALKSITIPDGVTTIGSSAFYGAGLTTLHFPASVTSTGTMVAEKSDIVTVTFAEGSQMKKMGHRAFMGCKSLVGPVILPEGLEIIGYNMFGGCTALKAVKIPNSVTTVTEGSYVSMFGSCSSLEFVQLSNQLKDIPPAMFEGCSSLKAISLPDGITTLGYKALRTCTSLQAIYLPSSLTTFGNPSNTSNDHGVFYQSPNVYFVSEPFEVFDGDTLIGNNFVMPEKPDVYYMPSGLTTLNSSEFQNCSKLNNFIVFPVGVTNASNAKTSQGAFYNIGSGRTTPVTLVFLGDMDAITIRQNDSSYCNINFVFANPADVDFNSVTFTIGSANNKKQTNTYAYFCNSNTVYDMSSFVTKNGAAYNVKEGDYAIATDVQSHFAEPGKAGVTEATCETNRFVSNFCYCGAPVNKVEEEGTAIGHSYNGAISYEFTSLTTQGAKYTVCTNNCGKPKVEEVGAVYTALGYSAKTFGTYSFVSGYDVNTESLAIYEETKDVKLSFGFAFNSASTFTDGEVTLDSFKIVAPVVGEVGDTAFSFYQYAISYDTEENLATDIIIAAYVIEKSEDAESLTFINRADGEVNGFDTISYVKALELAK